MTAADVVEVLDCLRAAEVRAWVDGGWGVDALLGEQTREHDDLDLVIDLRPADAAGAALAALGFGAAEDELPTRFTARDARGRQVDFHTVTFDAGGGGLQQLQDGRVFRYPPEGFEAAGTVGGVACDCLSAEVQVLCHTGYEPDAADCADVRALAARFGVPLPPAYRD